MIDKSFDNFYVPFVRNVIIFPQIYAQRSRMRLTVRLRDIQKLQYLSHFDSKTGGKLDDRCQRDALIVKSAVLQFGEITLREITLLGQCLESDAIALPIVCDDCTKFHTVNIFLFRGIVKRIQDNAFSRDFSVPILYFQTVKYRERRD